jgi:hypothetical protein
VAVLLFVNITQDAITVKSVVVLLYANTTEYETHARSAAEHLFVNTAECAFNVKIAEDRAFVDIKSNVPVVENAGVRLFVYTIKYAVDALYVIPMVRLSYIEKAHRNVSTNLS